MDIVGDLARILAPGEQRAALRLRQGKIIAVAADGTATITIGGDNTEISGIAVASHVSAVPGFACWLAVDGRDAFIIATIGPEVAAMPTGVVLPTAAGAAPAGWLLCDGSLVSRTTYARLFSVIGVTYGSGDGTSTFALPDMRGRVAVGRDTTQPEFNSLGEVGGAKTHTLTVGEMPAHEHAMDTPRWFAADELSGGSIYTPPTSPTATRRPNRPTSSVGGGGAHNNLQPYRVLNHIIKL